MIDQDAQRQIHQVHHQIPLSERTYKPPLPHPTVTQELSQPHTNAAAACSMEISMQQQRHPTNSTASQIASLHAPHTAQLTALSGHAHAPPEATASSVAAPCMHGTKRSGPTTDRESDSADVSHRAKQQRREEEGNTQLPVQGPQHRLSQQGKLLATPQQDSGLDGTCLNDTVGAIFIDASGG